MSGERLTEAEQRRRWIDLHGHIEAVIERKLRSETSRHLPVVMLAEDLADVVTSAVLEHGALSASQHMSDEEPSCGRLMVGSGTDTYDPMCELMAGHAGPCKSRDAIDQHRLVSPPPSSPSEDKRCAMCREVGAAYCSECALDVMPPSSPARLPRA